jgi:hypothetical protein
VLNDSITLNDDQIRLAITDLDYVWNTHQCLTPVLSRGGPSAFSMEQNGHPAVGSGTIIGPFAHA